ncbi:hypothetical protein GCM10007908_03680 [Rhizobium albus]|nr:hypothetical protein GCM10007908_03680 [Rhizobium albus]
MAAPVLDRRITIQRATTAPDAFNEPVQTWTDLKTLSAARRDVSDGEKFAAGQVGASLQSRFVIRHSSISKTITPVDRLSHEGAIWNIMGIKETQDGRRRFLEITAARDAD